MIMATPMRSHVATGRDDLYVPFMSRKGNSDFSTPLFSLGRMMKIAVDVADAIPGSTVGSRMR
jgi:hypothetical protein